MWNKFLLQIVVFICFIFFPRVAFAQSYNFVEITEKVMTQNKVGEFDQTILLLENIISDKKSTPYDRYQAYYLKYLTYKRLYSYDKAAINLELALQEGLKSKKADEVIAKVKIEKVFIAFDLLEFDKVTVLLEDVTSQDLAYILPNTKALYLTVLAVMEVKQNNFSRGNDYLEEAKAILKEHNPENLPLVYRKQIDVYRAMGMFDKSLESFKLGLFYAKEYNMDLYILNMYCDLAHFYNEIKDYDQAIIAQKICNQLAKEYDEGTIVGRLNILESKLDLERLEEEKKAEFYSIILIGIVFIVLSIVLFFLYRYVVKSREARIALREENNKLRARIVESLSNTSLTVEANNKQTKFTERQIDIIELVKEGKTNKEIGNILYISENTVKYHLKNIYDILSVTSRVEL